MRDAGNPADEPQRTYADLAKLRTEVNASRDYLLRVSSRRADLFGAAAASQAA
jgi:hypothetical protein